MRKKMNLYIVNSIFSCQPERRDSKQEQCLPNGKYEGWMSDGPYDIFLKNGVERICLRGEPYYWVSLTLSDKEHLNICKSGSNEFKFILEFYQGEISKRITYKNDEPGKLIFFIFTLVEKKKSNLMHRIFTPDFIQKYLH